MAQVFAVTAASDTVRLGGDGTGEVSFTISNVSGRGVRGRARLYAPDAAGVKWLSISGEAEQDYAAGQTSQATVKVAGPAGTNPAKHTFRLDEGAQAFQVVDPGGGDRRLGRARVPFSVAWNNERRRHPAECYLKQRPAPQSKQRTRGHLAVSG